MPKCHACEAECHTGLALCPACTARLQAAIRYCRQAVGPLEAIMAKQASALPVEPGPRASKAFAPLPMNADAADALDAIHDAAVETARALGAKPKTPEAALLFVAAESVRLPHMSGEDGDASYWLAKWVDARRAAERILEPPERKPRLRPAAGKCPACGGAMRLAAADESMAECGACGASMPVQALRAAQVRALPIPDVLTTPAGAEKVFANAGIRLPASTVRSWVYRGRLPQHAGGLISTAACARLLAGA
jgi:ferredoxin|nr:MAG TPA: DNA-directed RNA polymerase [Caudoviricetes sp.]